MWLEMLKIKYYNRKRKVCVRVEILKANAATEKRNITYNMKYIQYEIHRIDI